MSPKEEKIHVIVRCRPMNDRENGKGCRHVINMAEERGTCELVSRDVGDPDTVVKRKAFTFDRTYADHTTTEHIYKDVVCPIIQSVTEGYNGTIFAYGQTSCGKTFTMQGIKEPPEQVGIIPRAVIEIFQLMIDGSDQFIVHGSCFEIYNEEIRDLLGKNVQDKLDIGYTQHRGFFIKGLSNHPVSNIEQCKELMSKGLTRRATSSTLMNSESSRSHTVFTLCVETQSDQGLIRAGKLNLVDLAGSERLSKTGATGHQLKEGIKINLSLHTLGRVISVLAEGGGKPVPYRESNLTKVLHDSLGGSARTLMVACVSPADDNYEETLSTLRFASSAKKIANKPVINEDPKDALLKKYQEEVRELRAQLAETGDRQQQPTDTYLHNFMQEMENKRQEEFEAQKLAMQKVYEEKLQEMEKKLEEVRRKNTELEENAKRRQLEENARMKEEETWMIVSPDQLEAKEPELRIVLIGKTGSGKSATGNTLAGSAVFESKSSLVSITNVTEYATASYQDRSLVIVDTPGLFDTLETNDARKNEIMKCVALTSPGIHAVLFVTQIGRFTEEEQKTVKFYVEWFGQKVLDYMIVVFTREDNLEEDGRSLEQHLKTESTVLKDLIQQCGGRSLALNNRAKAERKERFRQDLINMIDETVAHNGGSCYTNEMFERTESIIREEEEDIRARVEEEKQLELDALEKVQSEFLLKEREALALKVDEEKLKHEKVMKETMEEIELMVQDLRRREEDKNRKIREEQEKRMRELQDETEAQLQMERQIKERLETEMDETRSVYEGQLRTAQERMEELRALMERDAETARMENERQAEEERARLEELDRRKDEEMRRLKEKAKEDNERLKEEDEKLARAVQLIFQKDYDAYIKRIEREARRRARREAMTGGNVFTRIIEGIFGKRNSEDSGT